MDIGRDKYWMPLREFQGKDRFGNKITKEVYRHKITGEVYYPTNKDGVEIGWNGVPPPTGDRVYGSNSLYAQNYDRIFRKEAKDGGQKEKEKES